MSLKALSPNLFVFADTCRVYAVRSADSAVLVDFGSGDGLDALGEVDIAAVKLLCGSQVCLIGNVNCGLMDTGTDEEGVASARYALENGMPGGGYIFSTSNCVYTGMALRRVELILDVWRRYSYGYL